MILERLDTRLGQKKDFKESVVTKDIKLERYKIRSIPFKIQHRRVLDDQRFKNKSMKPY